MTIGKNLLLFIIVLPLIGICVLHLLPKKKINLQKKYAFIITIITFVSSLLLWILFDESAQNFQFTTTVELNPYNNIIPQLGIDGISIFFILLTTLLIPICLLASWTNIAKFIKEFFTTFLLLESALCVVFSVLDLLIFYIFFELILIPMFIIIGIWGSRLRKIKAAYQFFLYTLLGSLFMLIALILIEFETGTTDLQTLLNFIQFNQLNEKQIWSDEREMFLWLAFFIAFAVKVPMVPFHIWLPEAHVEAPTAGSVLLAGILLKLGTYGLLRIILPLFPSASTYFTPLVFTLSILAIIFTSLTALRQIDLKKIIAYSSVAHMGFVTIGIFSANIQGIQGAMLIMISHGFVSSALFLCVGVLYDRYHTRLIKYYGGLAQTMPLFTITFVFFSLANLGFPGTSSFPGELLTLVGSMQTSFYVTILASTGMILSAAYSLWLCNRVLFGGTTQQKFNAIKLQTDLTKREIATFIPLIAGTLWMGLYPTIFINTMHLSILSLVYLKLF